MSLLSIGVERLRGVVGIAGDEPLLERLRVLVQDTTTDNHVKRKAVELFGTWSVNYRNEKGMERLAGLRSQLPTKVTIQEKKVVELTPFVRNVLHPKFVLQPQKKNLQVPSDEAPPPPPQYPPPNRPVPSNPVPPGIRLAKNPNPKKTLPPPTPVPPSSP
jgi:hypothetical protein